MWLHKIFFFNAISNNILLELEVLKMHHVKIKTERLGEITLHTRSPCLVLNRLMHLTVFYFVIRGENAT